MTNSAHSERALLIRDEDAERVGDDSVSATLLADFASTGGVMSANTAHLGHGADGPPPHFHTSSTEIFFMLDGALRVLAGDEILDISRGDLLLVPPHTTHAWRTTPQHSADVLIVFTPGIERFDYFRLADRVRRGEIDPGAVLDAQERFDNHFVDSPAWRRDSRAGSPPEAAPCS